MPPSGRGERGIGRSAALGGKLRLSGRRNSRCCRFCRFCRQSIRCGTRLPSTTQSARQALPKDRAPFASPVQGEVGLRQQSRRGCCVYPKRGRTSRFTPVVNPSVSLSADSSPYTGEPGADSTGRKLPFSRVNRVCRAAQGSRGRVRVRTACESRQLKFPLPAFLFQKTT